MVEHRSRTLISILLRFAGSMMDRARGLRPDEWGRANRTLPLWDLKQQRWGVVASLALIDRAWLRTENDCCHSAQRHFLKLELESPRHFPKSRTQNKKVEINFYNSKCTTITKMRVIWWPRQLAHDPSIEGEQHNIPVPVFVKDTRIGQYIHIMIKSNETFVGRRAS